MRKLSFIFLISFLTLHGWTQQTDIKWSPFGDKDKKEVLETTERFLESYIHSDFQNVLSYMDKSEINFGGDIWMQPQEFISMLQSLRGKSDLRVGAINLYTMDDAEKNSEIKSQIIKIYRMFSNYSIFVSAELVDNAKGSMKTIYLNFNLDDQNNWIINCFLDPSIGLASNISFPKERFRIESFEELKFTIPVPIDFSDKQVIEGQSNYTLAGETARDALIQVAWSEMIAPLDLLSYNWVMYITSKYDHSDFIIKYTPFGYRFEYFLKDQNGDLNKGITTTFETKDKFVYIQYFSFSETYNQIWIDIDMMLRYISIED